jgi:hypothetical protein
MDRPVPPLTYLLDCSKLSLQEFWNVQLNDAANRRKDLQRLLPEWIEAAAMALLAEWFFLYGEDLIAIAGAPPAEREKLLAALRIGFPDELAQVRAEIDAERLSLLGTPSAHARHSD